MNAAIQERLDRLYRDVYTVCGSLAATAFPTEEPVPFSEREKNGEGGMTLRPGDRWGRGGSCAWIRLEGTAPEAPEGFEAAILLDAGGEACLFDENGNPLKGFTNVQSEFTVALGKPAKRVWFFPPEWCGKDLLLWADAGANDLFGWKPENGLFIQADFALFDSRKRALYYGLETLASYLEAIGEKDADGIFGRAEALWSDPEECASFVRSVLSGGNTDGNFVAALGHAHLDLAWLWPIRETKRKAVRTLSTVVSHMARYPDYRFCVSQPQMLSWVKESQPGLYEEIRRLHREGRVETVGGSWVEMDTNLPDGESLVRQMIYGQRFWKEEFGTPSGILWLPDTFGYSAQLPQLLKKAGMTYFLTTKLSWNAVNKFPYASFFWEGLDGTKVLTHIPPEGNYNSAARPDSVKKAEAAPCSMMLFGIGDGGGGPGMEHLERLAREKDLPGMPSVRQMTAKDFFRRLEDASAEIPLPVWTGELYLEKHQGTYTSQAANKAYNRICERELHRLEFLGAAASCLCPDYRWNAERVRRIWETVLLYQFHDILPGSSIDRVYRETGPSYEEVLKEIRALSAEALDTLRSHPDARPAASLLNLSPFDNPEPSPETGICPETPARAYCFTEYTPLSGGKGSRSEKSGEDYLLDNGRLTVRFSAGGTVLSVRDGSSGREFLSGESNRLFVYRDPCDGWEVPDRAENPPEEELRAISSSCGRKGETAFLSFLYRFRGSEIRQTAFLAPESGRIEWETEADWREPNVLLRAEFHPAARSEYAVCGVPFGELARPTMHRDSWEAAKREVCFQGYCDLSDGTFGGAVLSDCKYGIDVRDCVLSLALLRAPTFPGKHADIGHHAFRYAFLPHKGGTENVRPEAFRMRAPAEEIPFLPPLTASFVSAEGLLAASVKPAENGNGIVVRLYNPTDRPGTAKVRFAPELGISSFRKANLLEGPEEEIPDGILRYGPFEVVTLLVETESGRRE